MYSSPKKTITGWIHVTYILGCLFKKRFKNSSKNVSKIQSGWIRPFPVQVRPFPAQFRPDFFTVFWWTSNLSCMNCWIVGRLKHFQQIMNWGSFPTPHAKISSDLSGEEGPVFIRNLQGFATPQITIHPFEVSIIPPIIKLQLLEDLDERPSSINLSRNSHGGFDKQTNSIKIGNGT